MLLVLDEIATGFGRTGRMFACEHAGIAPDIMCLAKGLGGGFPMGAFAYTQAIRDVLTPGAHGSTFGGNPLACAVGIEVVKLLESGDFQERSETLGAHLHAALSALIGHGVVAVRGRTVKLGFVFPAEVSVLRREIYDRIQEENRAAAGRV